MGKIKYLVKRITKMDYGRMFRTINEIHQKTNKNRILLFFDVVYCGIRYQAGYIDYSLFEMYNLDSKQRKTIITRGINNSFIKKYNDKEYMKIFNDKIKFNKRFDKYLKRDWLELNGENLKEFENFCKKNKKFIAKPTNQSCGKGVLLVNTKNKKLKQGPKSKYSQDTRNQIVELKNKGTPVKIISRMLDIPIRTVYYILKKEKKLINSKQTGVY